MKNIDISGAETKTAQMGHVIDHLVDALGGEPCCTLRRAVILADIDENPGTLQKEIIHRLQADKASLSRDIEWLYDYGCVMRQTSAQDGRAMALTTCGYAKRNLDLALAYFDYDHKSLKNFLIRLIQRCGDYKPTLRDAKILAVVSDKQTISKASVLEALYNGPSTTDHRAVYNLLDHGFIKECGDETGTGEY